MAFCTQCGAQLNDGAVYCGKCGAKKTSLTSTSEIFIQTPQQANQNYTLYETFDNPESETLKTVAKTFGELTDAMAKVMYHNHPKALESYESFKNDKQNKKDIMVRKFTITDKSIIFDGKEIGYDELMIFCPKDNSVKFTIDNKIYWLSYKLKDRHRLYYSLHKANSFFPKTSLYKKLRYASMAYQFLKSVKSAYSKQAYISFSEDNEYDELWVQYQSKMIDKTGEATAEQKLWIARYNEVIGHLNNYFKEENPINNLGHNREPETLEKLINSMIGFETDMDAVIKRYNESLRLEEMRKQEEWARQCEARENGDGGFLSSVLSTAAGVAIGNKISNRRSSVKQDSGRAYYMCPIGCKFKYSEHGVPRCRLSTAWSNSPEPEKCGHGHRYR